MATARTSRTGQARKAPTVPATPSSAAAAPPLDHREGHFTHLGPSQPAGFAGYIVGRDEPTDAVLVAIHGSPAAMRAIHWCAEHAQALGLDIVVIHVISRVGEWLMSAVQINFQQIERERQILLDGRWTGPLRDAGIPFRTRLLVGDPIDSVLNAADEEAADLVIIGKTGHAPTDYLLGVTAMKLAHRTQRPLLLIPDTDLASGST